MKICLLSLVCEAVPTYQKEMMKLYCMHNSKNTIYYVAEMKVTIYTQKQNLILETNPFFLPILEITRLLLLDLCMLQTGYVDLEFHNDTQMHKKKR